MTRRSSERTAAETLLLVTRAHRTIIRPLQISVALISLACAPCSAAAFEPPPLDIDAIETRAAELDTEAPDSQRAAELYEESVTWLEKAAAADSRNAGFAAKAADAPQRTDTIRAQLDAPAATPPPEPSGDVELTDLEARQSNAQAELTAARSAEEALRTEQDRRRERRTEIAEGLATLRERATELTTAAGSAAPEGTTGAAIDAWTTRIAAERRATDAEIAALESERESYDARQGLLPLRLDLAARVVEESEAAVTRWQEIVGRRRAADAEREVLELEQRQRRAAAQAEALQEYAERTRDLAEARVSLSQRISTANQQATDTRARLAELRTESAEIRRRLAERGLSRVTGRLLRRVYESLPPARALRADLSETSRDLLQAESDLIEYEDQRSAVGDISAVARDLVEQVDPPASDRSIIENYARELAAERRAALDELLSDTTRLIGAVFELEDVQRGLLDDTNDFRNYAGERILWVRSIPAVGMPKPGRLAKAVAWYFDGDSWSESLSVVGGHHRTHAPEAILSVLLVIAMLVMSRISVRRLRHLAELVSRFRTDAFRHTIFAGIHTLSCAAPIPLVLGWMSWILLAPTASTPLADSVGQGLGLTALLAAPLSAARQLARRGGLADAHLRWPAPALATIRRSTRWLLPIVVPAAAVAFAVEQHGDEAAAASLGRIAFTVLMLAYAAFFRQIFRPGGPVLREFLARHESGAINRLRFVWYPVLAGAPLLLAVLAWFGYFYTALRLETRLEFTVLLLLVLVVANGLLGRWLFVARRRAAVEDARRRREQAQAETESDTVTTTGPTEAVAPAIDEDKLDLPAISLQTQQLFLAALAVACLLGLSAIWSDALPALRMLDRLQLYPVPRVVQTETAPEPSDQTPAPPSGQAAATDEDADRTVSPTTMMTPVPIPANSTLDAESPTPEDISITVADVGAMIIIFIATAVAFRNLPGLVEIVVIQRLPLDAGSRYALSTVLRYGIVLIGLTVGLAAIGLSWSRVQWLAAALTFGLAFGLQEIFANFVSGLIILAERPVRIGDTVTVGNVTGSVTRIRMRATTITDWDRKELIIPNKNFITGDVINWTLSDPTLRLTIPVGISYSADIKKAESVLLELAQAHPLILDDPKPYVIFGNFGDSTLDFELRVFLPHADNLLTVKHDMHTRITEAFRREDIEIAFPQRDLHIRSAGDLAGVVKASEDSPNSR